MPALMVSLGLAASNGKAKDLIIAGAVSLDGEKVTTNMMLVEQVVGRMLRVGKHQFKKLV